MTTDMNSDTMRTASGYIIAAFLTTVGLTTIIDPVGRSKAFGIPARSQDKTILAYIKPMGARDLSLGLTVGTLMFNGDQKNAGLVALIALVIPTMDAWAVWRYNGRLKEAWGHVIGIGFVGSMGLWLIS